jgi:hypothetical protein
VQDKPTGGFGMAADSTHDTADDTAIDRFRFTSFAALASLQQAAQAAVALYGPDAATAAAWCARTARFDGREADYRFWVGVFERLGADRAGPELGQPDTEGRKEVIAPSSFGPELPAARLRPDEV